MRFAFLGSSTSWYLRDLQRALAVEDSMEPVSFEQLSSTVHPHGCRVGSDHDLLEFDAVLVRAMPPGSLEQVIFRMDALAQLERAGVPVVNPPRSLEIAIDKYLALARLQQLGLNVPTTCCCQTADQALAAFDELEQDVVVKPLFGGEGRGIMRVSDRVLAERTFKTLEQLRAVIHVQRFIPNAGADLRLLTVGDEVLGMRRIATDDWRTNVSQGAHAESYTLSTADRRLALRVSAAVGAPLCALDLLPGTDGKTYALEVNAVPGWRALSRVGSIDIAAKIINYLQAVASRQVHRLD